MNCEPCIKEGKGPIPATRIPEMIQHGVKKKVPMCTRHWKEQGNAADDAPTVAAVVEAQEGAAGPPEPPKKLCACGCGGYVYNLYFNYIKGHKTRMVVEQALPGFKPNLSAGAIPGALQALEAERAAYAARIEQLDAAISVLKRL